MSNFKNKKYEIIEGWGSIAFNLVISIMKLGVFLFTHSISVLADAAHSFSDIFTSALVIIGAKISNKKPDSEHPFGHGRADTIAAFVMAFFIILTGVEFLQFSVKRILSPEPIKWSFFNFGILATTILIKLGNVFFAAMINKKVESKTIKTDFWHHLTDVISTLIVLLGLILSKYNVPMADGIAGVLVSFFIMSVGISIVKDSFSVLLGEAPKSELLQKIRKIAKRTNKLITNIHDIIVNNYGSRNIISLHIEVPSSLSISEAHEIAEAVEDNIENHLNASAVVHIDPVNKNHKYYPLIEKLLKNFLQEHKFIKSYHDLRLVGGNHKFNVLFDLVTDSKINYDKTKLLKEVKKYLKQNCEKIHEIGVKIEPFYTY